MGAIADDGWLSAHALLLALLSMAQAEVDGYAATCGVIHSYASLCSAKNLPFAPPPLAELPIVNAVELYVAAPSDQAEAPAATASAKGGKGAPAKGGTGAGPAPESVLCVHTQRARWRACPVRVPCLERVQYAVGVRAVTSVGSEPRLHTVNLTYSMNAASRVARARATPSTPHQTADTTRPARSHRL